VLLTQQRLRDSCPPAAKVVCLDTDWNDRIACASDRNPAADIRAENLGLCDLHFRSTGNTEGSLVTHRQRGAIVFRRPSRGFISLTVTCGRCSLARVCFFSVGYWGALLYGGR